MEQTVFGSTGLRVSRTGFGCIPIQRIPFEESTALLRHAYENGVTLFDTANSYTTSEERIGIALEDVRDKIVLCTKSMPLAPDKILENIDNSLWMLKTDYIDVFQVHNPTFVPRPGGEDGIYDCLLQAKALGKIRHIGISFHKRNLAEEAVLSGLYETLQFPFTYLSSPEDLALIELCRERNMGVLAMKALAGGLLTKAKPAFAFLRQYENLIPIWGIEKMSQLQEFLAYEAELPALDAEMEKVIAADREELSGNFCRACGYCMPCPVGIQVPISTRITLMVRRMPAEKWFTSEWQDNMRKIDACSNCGHCKAHCPYGLDIPPLLKYQQGEYFKLLDQFSLGLEK